MWIVLTDDLLAWVLRLGQLGSRQNEKIAVWRHPAERDTVAVPLGSRENELSAAESPLGR